MAAAAAAGVRAFAAGSTGSLAPDRRLHADPVTPCPGASVRPRRPSPSRGKWVSRSTPAARCRSRPGPRSGRRSRPRGRCPARRENTVGDGSGASARPAERGQLVRREPDAVAEAVPECRPGPAASMTARASRVESAGRAAARRLRGRAASSASIAAPWARATTLVERRSRVGRLADEERPRHVAAIARRPGPRSRTAAPAPADTGRSPGEPCGSAARGPERHATSNASAPRRLSGSATRAPARGPSRLRRVGWPAAASRGRGRRRRTRPRPAPARPAP